MLYMYCLIFFPMYIFILVPFVDEGYLGGHPAAECWEWGHALRLSPGEGNTHSSILAWRIPWIEEPGGL